MNIENTKLELIQRLQKTKDKATLLKIRKVFEEESADWYDELSVEEKKEIELGIRQANEGKLVSHESVMAKLKKWH
ncbi:MULTISPECIES: hypothetical protein [Mesonia]|uniref:hypothetical protein n=1 Tax=Mesonia TaxID=232115 RepID=UPI0024BBDFEE|nr:hypothetical protein [Mesonia mobilis]